MTKSVEVTVYELRWPNTDAVYVGSTVSKLSRRLSDHRCSPRPCYAHLDANAAQIVPVRTYVTSDKFDRQPEAAHKAQLRKQNVRLLQDAHDNHNQPLWLSEKTKAHMSKTRKGKQTGSDNPRYAPFSVTWLDGRVDRWETTREAAAAYGIANASVWKYLNGKSTPGGDKRSAHLLGTVWQYL